MRAQLGDETEVRIKRQGRGGGPLKPETKREMKTERKGFAQSLKRVAVTKVCYETQVE
jgi:hypothetical protein